MPTTINGAVHPSNKHCIDWSLKGLLAYATDSVITVVDPWRMQRIQVLEWHSAAICELRWSPFRCWRSENEENRLATADVNGNIVICDVFSSHKIASLNLPGSTVLKFVWFEWKDTSRDFILSLHSGGLLVLWNIDDGSPVWKSQLESSYTSFSCDPFDGSRLCMLSGESSIVVLRGMSLASPPSSVQPVSISFPDVLTAFSFHHAFPHIILAATRQSVHVVHAEAALPLCKGALDSTVLSILPCYSRDAFYLIHHNGAISLRSVVTSSSAEGVWMDVVSCCGVDVARGSDRRPIAAALCPSSNAQLALIHASGTVSFFHLESKSIAAQPYRSYSVDDVIKYGEDLKTVPDAGLRLRVGSCIEGVASGSSLIRVRPESCTPHPSLPSHLAALANGKGQLMLLDLFGCAVVRRLQVQNSAIKCMEWCGELSVVTVGHTSTLSSNSVVRNDVFITHVLTGVSSRLRSEKDESPITIVRISHYNCYMAIAFQSDPLEIWDVSSLRMLRKMSRTCPLIVDMAWSSKHHGVKETHSLSVYRENLVVVDSDNRLYHVVVKGMHVRDGKEVNTQWRGSGWQLRCIAWKDDLLCMGDADGRIILWDLHKRRSRESRHLKTPCIKMNFSRVAHDNTLVVLHPTVVVVWDAERLVVQSSVSLPSNNAILDVELCGLTLFAVCADNCVRVASDAHGNRAIPKQDLKGMVGTEMLSVWEEDGLDSEGQQDGRCALTALRALSLRTRTHSALKRYSALYRLLGERESCNVLWMVESGLDGCQLPPHLLLFWPSHQLKRRESASAAFMCRHFPSAVSIEESIVLGGSGRTAAIDALIASPNDVVVNSLKAALLASTQSGEDAQSLIRLIATNLIASDHISHGVELMFLVDAGVDACKYLQSVDMWQKSVRYAKMGLREERQREIIERFITHLHMDNKPLSVVWEASLCKWTAVRDALSAFNMSTLARLVHSLTSAEQPSHAPPS